MKLNMTFDEICAALKKQAPQDPKLIQAIDNLLGLAIVCSPTVLGPAAIAALPTLAVKNEIIKAGTWAFNILAGRPTVDYLQRHETMEMAYGLLTFTAFFDTLDAKIPKALRSAITALATQEGEAITQRSAAASADDPLMDGATTQLPIDFPHPTETLGEQTQRHQRIWKQLAQGFVTFVKSHEAWNKLNDKQKQQVASLPTTLEKETAKRFEAQYFELARKFEDFAIWANLHSHDNTRAQIAQLLTCSPKTPPF